MSAQAQVFDLLRLHGAVLVRQRKHQIYRFPDGTIFVTTSTPSDTNSWLNSLTFLRRKLGVRNSRPYTQKSKYRPAPAKSDRTVWFEYLQDAGIERRVTA